MQAFFTYLLQVNIALALFYLLYAVAFKRDTFFQLRRLFLLSVILFSMLYPFFAVPALAEVVPFSFSRGEEVRSEVLIGDVGWEVFGDEEVVASRSIPWVTVLVALYWVVTAAFILRFFVQLFSVYRVWKRSERRLLMGNVVYRPTKEVTPFSFFKWIFIYIDAYSEQELQQILLHESTHVKQWHSIDVVITELLCLFFWWNPFTWLLKREVIMNLEYLADNHVLHEGVDSREYQYHLLRLTYHESAVPIANNFNVSQLKQRIMMMNKTKSPALRVAKYLIALPLLFLFVVANSVYAGQDESVRLSEVTSDIIDAEALLQTNEYATIVAQESNINQEPGEPIFQVVENAPEFLGGQEGLMKFLSENTRYPVIAIDHGIQGRVIVRFVVTKTGKVSNVEVMRGVDPSLDREAVRVVEAMPAWKPGTQKGEAVNVYYTLPIVFKLPADTKKESQQEEQKDIKKMIIEFKSPADTKKESQPVEADKSDGEKRSGESGVSQKLSIVLESGEPVYETVDDAPEFPGGIEALMKFLSDNVRYPVEAQEKGVQGRVICRFVVKKDGSTSNVEVLRGVDPSLDAEAIRVIDSMPAWKPGTQKGEAVNVHFTIPIQFSLSAGTKEDNQQGDAGRSDS
ncbi:MAG: M56 family metallopeptidase [Bacteroidota bacterium]|nr:M56 family metallopeptidase [Bacteroidota bacterium]